MDNYFTEMLARDQALIENRLSQVFGKDTDYGDLKAAMEYLLLSGGKRIRPVLTLESCVLCGGKLEDALPFAIGVEMVHTYSLIHDDLPAMDDDDLRRGKPTSHVVFGEATAILAGDGLLTAAFEQLAGAELPPGRIVEAVRILSSSAGPAGMVGGQILDMAGEGRAMTRDELEQLQRLKTGALICAACELGAVAAGGSPEQREKLRNYAQYLGLAFQIRDDILDVIGNDEVLGKPVDSDIRNGKNTFVTALGLEECSVAVQDLTLKAQNSLDGFDDPKFHIWLAGQLAGRNK